MIYGNEILLPVVSQITNMKRIIIICEGETEKEFCTKLLSTYFAPKNMMSIKTNNIRSFINDCIAVNGIQSPKQPQVRILPDSTA